MSSDKYPVGMTILVDDHSCEYTFRGTVVENCKLPGDICVKWEDGKLISYDENWLDENARREKMLASALPAFTVAGNPSDGECAGVRE